MVDALRESGRGNTMSRGQHWVRMALLGNYGTDLKVRNEINRFLRDRDPYGTAAFVHTGVERGEVRRDIDEAMIVSMVEWTVERFQDALLTEELDPGLFSRQGNRPEKTAGRIAQFLDLLQGAIGERSAAVPRKGRKEK